MFARKVFRFIRKRFRKLSKLTKIAGNKIKNKNYSYINYLANYSKEKQLKNTIKFNKSIYVFGSPFHSNMGDQAQSYCIENWCRKNYPEHKVSVIDTVWALKDNSRVISRIKSSIKYDDIIILHSGYHMTDLYVMENQLILNVLNTFNDRPILIFPQTIFYQNIDQAQNMALTLEKHSNVFLMCRDEVSYNFANNTFYNTRNVLFPDIVTSLIGKKKYNETRDKILLCMRNDKESVISQNQMEEFISKLQKHSKCELTDTTISLNSDYIQLHREKILEKQFKKFAKAKVVITDRYHGTIFSLIAGTPVIVLNSSDHKLSSGVKWFPDSFSDYVYYAGDLNSAMEIVEKVINLELDHNLPNYFESQYYSKLKDMFENV